MLEIGGRFGDFEVVRELGRGGMGAVYLVRDPATGDEYAAKVMFSGLSEGDETAKRRFLREAEIAMAADHPNLVRVYDVGRDPETGLAYMIMDYVDGGSLRDRIVARLVGSKGPYSVGEAMAVVRPLLSALSEAERNGIVHRDIKPDNILFDGEVPKLADLGIAKVTDVTETQLTMSDVIIGTPAYMAPEQLLDSRQVDGRADLYSLGIVLWEMLVLDRPLPNADKGEYIERAVRGQRIPNIRLKRKKISPRIAEFIRRLTEPKPERRFESADSALLFLDEWRLRRKRKLILILVGVALVAIALMLAAAYVVLDRLESSERSVEKPVFEEFSIPDGVE